MRQYNPSQLSLFTAVILSAITALSSFVFHTISGIPDWVKLIILSLIVLIAAYLLIVIVLNRFIYEKIRLIYKTIRSSKTPKNGKSSKRNKTESLEKVEKEVAQWAENQSRQIEDLTKLATYRREFMGNISHELKTPIFNIQGYVLTLLEGGLEDPNINREYLLRTEKSIDRMIAIVEDLETIAQLEANELKLIFRKFDLVELAREVMEFLEMKAEKNHIRLYFGENYDKPINVNADRERIRQVFVNLIENAIKYSNPQQTESKVKVSFFDMDDSILVEITDNGIGIEQQDLPRVFERFFRTDKGRKRENKGSGLGLAIVKHIIEAHNQTIHVRSTIGIGTTFAFTLAKSS